MPDDVENHTQASEKIIELQGVLNPIEKLRLATRDPGIVEKICVSVGDTIEAGDPVAILDSRLFSAEVNAATNELAAANQEAKNEVVLELAKIFWPICCDTLL